MNTKIFSIYFLPATPKKVGGIVVRNFGYSKDMPVIGLRTVTETASVVNYINYEFIAEEGSESNPNAGYDCSKKDDLAWSTYFNADKYKYGDAKNLNKEIGCKLPVEVTAAAKDDSKSSRKVTESCNLPGAMGMQFCKIPLGSFMMGSPESEKDRDPTPGEETQRKVTFTKWYCDFKDFKECGTLEMLASEVSKNMWLIVTTGESEDRQAGRAPVSNISFSQVQEFFVKLNERFRGDGYTYRLPSEAEWEYAARAGTTERGYLGSNLDAYRKQINCNFGSQFSSEIEDVNFRDSKNKFGLKNVLGNVSEFVEDFHMTLQSDLIGKDLLNPKPNGPGPSRTPGFRGGSAADRIEDCRSAGRFLLSNINSADPNVGFRIVRTKK
ncbi:MAG: formylglycine-generating enzyme family protein [Proteobacteria bacterium]|nr:formylglycine-generating enzyme family protein [Pseudomonadota bacterium]